MAINEWPWNPTKAQELRILKYGTMKDINVVTLSLRKNIFRLVG